MFTQHIICCAKHHCVERELVMGWNNVSESNQNDRIAGEVMHVGLWGYLILYFCV